MYVVCDRLLDAETNEHCEFDGRVALGDGGRWFCPGCNKWSRVDVLEELRKLYAIPQGHVTDSDLVVIPPGMVTLMLDIVRRTRATRELLGILISDEDNASIDFTIASLEQRACEHDWPLGIESGDLCLLGCGAERA